MFSAGMLDRYSIPLSVDGVDYKIGIADVVIDMDIERRYLYITDFEISRIHTEDGVPVVGPQFDNLVSKIKDSFDFSVTLFDREVQYQEELEVEHALLMRDGDDR